MQGNKDTLILEKIKNKEVLLLNLPVFLCIINMISPIQEKNKFINNISLI
jgi:hypothetical protein